VSLPVAQQCLSAVIARLRELGIEGIGADEIVARDVPVNWMEFAPRGLSVVQLKRLEAGGTTASEDYGYQFLVVRSRGSAKGTSESTAGVELWKAQVFPAFNYRRLSPVTEVYQCRVADGSELDKRPWEDNRALSVVLITCWARERRP
jgi:hypothetical protein